MDFASATIEVSAALQGILPSVVVRLSSRRSCLRLPGMFSPAPLSRTVLTFARRRNTNSTIVSSSSPKKGKKSLPDTDNSEEDDPDEDAFEALFRQVDEDLKSNDNSIDDDEITEEDIIKLEKELEAAAVGDDDELLGILNDDCTQEKDDAKEDQYEEEDYDIEETPKLRNWQLKRLAYALKVGRRKISIQNLVADVCLDRAVVLQLLREPPPNLLLMSNALPDEPAPTVPILETKLKEIAPAEKVTKAKKPAKVPTHVMQSRWFAQKKLKKVQVETLERVYRRTKRPTNALISNIVHVIGAPRKKVVKWFEEKRVEDGVPSRRLSYKRPASDSVLSCQSLEDSTKVSI